MSGDAVDVIVVGGGPAGMSCAITARDLGLTVSLFEGMALGGELNTLETVSQLPGRASAPSGPDFAADLMDDLLERGVDVRYEQVDGVSWDGAGWVCGSDGRRAPWLVLATGAEIDISGLDGAEIARGRGVSLCASCDAPMFAGKPVAVLGGGRDAVSEAHTLAQYASTVILVVSEHDEAALRRSGVEPSQWVAVRRIIGVVGSPVEGLRVETLSGEEQILAVAGLFPTEPRLPRSALAGLPAEIRGAGAVPVGSDLIAAEQLLAIGDVRANSSTTVSGAIGDGTAAAWTVLRSRAAAALAI